MGISPLFSHPLIVSMLSSIESECKISIQSAYHDHSNGLRDMLLYHMGWSEESTGNSGKRLRPLLLLLCTHMSGGDWQTALPAAVSVELIHNFSLIHDDIEDNSTMRHNRDTLWVKYGLPQAINAGDSLFSLALNHIWKLLEVYPPDFAVQCSQLLTTTCIKLTEGQYLDIDFEKRKSVSMENYLAMTEGKTTILLSTATHMGALLGNNGPATLEDFHAFGHNLGLAFQIIDDYLGIWGDDALTGKSKTSDLLTGKHTYPVILGCLHSAHFARAWQQSTITPETIPTLLEYLQAAGIREKTLAEAERLTNLAHRHLELAASGHSDYGLVAELADWLLSRSL